ncbi:MAG TPA: CocE/NonD family hydrolase [Galbitalea sp.]
MTSDTTVRQARVPRSRRSLVDRIVASRNGLPPVRPVSVLPVRIPLRDGVELGAALYVPQGTSKGALLSRGPYGRGFVFSLISARIFASQGYTVLFVSSRGTGDSGGDFDPMRTEATDGQDVVTWMRTQPWYPGSFATIGGSYLGHTQWALLSDPPSDLVACVIQVGPHDFARHAWGTGTFNLDFVGWAEQIAVQANGAGIRSALRLRGAAKRLKPVLEGIPFVTAIDAYFGETVPWVHDRLTHPDIEDPFWSGARHADAIEKVSVPILLLSGWQDIFIEQTLEQYVRLHERGIDVGMTIGPWVHLAIAGEALAPMTREGLDWMGEKLDGSPNARQFPVRIYVTGANEWRGLPSWPPAAKELTLSLSPGTLGTETTPTDTADSSFTYDPAHPTPTLGGPLIENGGCVDDSSLAERGDVLAYTGSPLDADLTVIGTVRLRLAHSTEHDDADLFVRLSEVDARGHSHNVTETYLRLPVGRGAGPIELRLLPTAHRFSRGNRIRLLIAGGSFPQYARNPGTGENPLTATEVLPNVHTVSHAAGASVLILPVVA